MNKQILRLAIPNIISNLSVPLLGVVDTAVLGHLEEIYYLGALAVGGIVFNFIYWGFGFLRMGTTGLTAQAYGTKDDEQVFLILVRTLLIALTGALLLILTQKLIA
ncbi:MAG: MATE family efflux transporter, partial [Caldithrix sp.]